jgi:hypothetical protein
MHDAGCIYVKMFNVVSHSQPQWRSVRIGTKPSAVP